MSASVLLFALAAAGGASAFEVGTASWYGGKFQGRKTANGEIFDTNKFTAAHRTLPFHTEVKVTNLDNGNSTVVRINDRGPFVQGRIIDLSRAAAEELDMIHSGTARVRLEIVGAAAPADGLKPAGDPVQPTADSADFPGAEEREGAESLDSVPLPEPELPEAAPRDRRGAGESAAGSKETGTSRAAREPDRTEQPKSSFRHIRYKVQLGSFSIEENARLMKEYLRNRGLAATFESGPGGVIRVVIAGVEKHALPELIARLEKIGVTDYLLRKES